MYKNAAGRHIAHGFISALEDVVRSNQLGIAVADANTELTYAELWSIITKLAQVLEDIGVTKGDRVVFMLPNSVDFIVLHLAIIRAAAISVPIDLATPDRTVRDICESCSPALVVCASESYLQKSPITRGTISMARLLECAQDRCSDEFVSHEVDPSKDLTSIMFTSGSTGTPKGVKLTHHNNLAAIRNIINYCEYTSSDFEVVTLPLTHSFGLGQANSMLLCGGGTYLAPGMLKMKSVANALEKYKATGFPTTPAGVDLILSRYSELFQRKGSHLKRMVVNSAPLLPSQTAKLQALFPEVHIYVYYGLTEASRSCKLNLTEVGPDLYDSVGPVMEGVRLSIDDQTSEVFISGETVSSGYWPDDEHPRSTDDFPEIATGDMGVIRDGLLFITGRLKDQINVGGYKVSPVEVESVLKQQLPHLKFAVLGRACDTGDEQVICLVEESVGGNITREQLRDIAVQNLEFYKVPSEFVFVSVIPTIINGKIGRAKGVQIQELFIGFITHGHIP